MKRSVRKAALVGLSSAALLTSLSVGATSASAIDQVSCRPDFLKVQMHYTNGAWFENCYANAGETWFPPFPNTSAWVTKIETGNNRVQWFGDGRWQPEQPIGKWTTYAWPNFSNGVRIEAIRIL
ncbi:beta/gamma crystallin domain-containing protein [Streptomyces flaveolus]|uniref:beta/gamma crystallin domain-containing protein n=1 Tax=Streptomyces flaveolus TaxID=67297 RepID=UPI00343D12C6